MVKVIPDCKEYDGHLFKAPILQNHENISDALLAFKTPTLLEITYDCPKTKMADITMAFKTWLSQNHLSSDLSSYNTNWIRTVASHGMTPLEAVRLTLVNTNKDINYDHGTMYVVTTKNSVEKRMASSALLKYHMSILCDLKKQVDKIIATRDPVSYSDEFSVE